MLTKKILLYPGDGIGPEVISEAVKALRYIERSVCGKSERPCHFDLHEVDWGVRYWRRCGREGGRDRVVPPDFLEQMKRHDAILLGAIGDPRVLPDHLTLAPLIAMRQQLDQYVCLRPAKLLRNVASPLAAASAKQRPIDLVVVRENSEGEYACIGGRFRRGTPAEVALEVAVHSRAGIERIVRYAFELSRAQGRRKHVTLATKSNAIKHGMVLWDSIFADVAKKYPDVRADKAHVDALAMDFVRRPHTLDVVVGSNLFGDILSDIGGAIVGSLGLAPSANINPERRFPSMFEPVHGSAVDIAGKGIANPVGALRATAMMLDFLELPKAARILDRAVEASIEEGVVRTPDLGGKSTCAQVGDDVIRKMKMFNSEF